MAATLVNAVHWEVKEILRASGNCDSKTQAMIHESCKKIMTAVHAEVGYAPPSR